MLAALSLSACAHVERLDVDDFQHDDVPMVRYQRDSAECESRGVDMQNRIGGSDATYIYNRTYAACMRERGYRPAEGLLDVF